jgi:hypothetical protein
MSVGIVQTSSAYCAQNPGFGAVEMELFEAGVLSIIALEFDELLMPVG